MTEFFPLSPANHTDFLRLYRNSFPAEEQRPYADEADLAAFLTAHSDSFRITAAIHQGSFAGFISTWHFPGYIYGEHAAIDPALRNKGVGSAMFANWFGTADRGLLIEVEPSGSTPMSDRRIAFYKRLGFVERNDISYIQPPYAPGLDPVQLTIMTRGDVDLSDPVKALTPLARDVYGHHEPIVSLK